jgi:phage terminase large subunit
MAISDRKIVIPYAPRRIFLPYHERTQRWSAIVAHRRCGKTVACVNDLIRAAITLEKPDGRYAYIAPLFNQAKDVAWLYLKRYAQPLLASPPNETELRIDLLNGSRIRLYGADNPDRLRGIYLDGVVLDEYAQMAPSLWGEVIRPLLTDRQGWATFIGTPKGKDKFGFWGIYDKSQNEAGWFSLMLKASVTGILPLGELAAARLDMTPEQYEQEFECSFEAAILGAYYGKEMANAEAAGHIRVDLSRLEGSPVHTAWDLGNGDHMAIWAFQVGAGEIRVIDYLSAYGYSMEKYCSELNARGYHGVDYVPHDARVKSMETGRTRVETLIALGRKPTLVPDHYVEDRIEATRLTFPRIWFDAKLEGLEALRQYRADYDEKLRTFKDKPKADWSTHAADAFGYMCVAWKELIAPPPPKPPGRDVHKITMDEAWQLHEGKLISPFRRETRI